MLRRQLPGREHARNGRPGAPAPCRPLRSCRRRPRRRRRSPTPAPDTARGPGHAHRRAGTVPRGAVAAGAGGDARRVPAERCSAIAGAASSCSPRAAASWPPRVALTHDSTLVGPGRRRLPTLLGLGGARCRRRAARHGRGRLRRVAVRRRRRRGQSGRLAAALDAVEDEALVGPAKPPRAPRACGDAGPARDPRDRRRAPIIRLGLNRDRSLEVPKNFGDTGWWTGGRGPVSRVPRSSPATSTRTRSGRLLPDPRPAPGRLDRRRRPRRQPRALHHPGQREYPKAHFPTARVCLAGRPAPHSG